MERKARNSAPAPRRMLVVGRTTDRDGHALRGVEEECRAIAALPGVTLRLNPGNLGLFRLVGDLEQFRTIHIAAHMFSDNVNPWRSGVLLGSGSDDAAYLRASDIATRHLGARLVVLSGCTSAAARSLPGEGPQGLASAFLCAGANTVVATLWQVRDDVAADFAKRLHAGLARGMPAAQAVREAQLGMRAAGRGAGDWGAFVVWGSGGDGAARN